MDFDYTTETITPDNTNVLTIGGTGGLEIPYGTTAQRPGSASNGLIRYNTDTNQLEGYFSNSWSSSISNIANQVVVQKTPGAGEFSSIADALSSITGASATDPVTIVVYPGTYSEPEMTMPNYVQITGLTEYGVVIQPLTSTQHLFNMSLGTTINFVDIQNVGTGYTAIRAIDVGYYALCHKVSMINCDTGWDIQANTVDSTVYLEYCDAEAGTTGVSVTSTSGFSMYANFENFYIYGNVINPDNGLFVSGTGTAVNIQAFGFEGEAGTGNGINVQDGATLVAKAGHIYAWDIGSVMFNTGAASDVQYLSVEIADNTTWDLFSEHPDGTGTLNGSARGDFVDASASPNFTFAFADVVSNKYIQTGAFFLGNTTSTLTNVTDLIIETSALGLMSGGELSIVSGLTVNIAAGTGYINNGSDVVTRTTWASTNITLSANSSIYIYIDATGAVLQASSPPDELSHIILARALTGPSSVITSGPVSFDIRHYGNSLDEFLKSTMGPVYSFGSIVTENISTPRSLDVTAGSWYYSIQNVMPSSGTGITFLDVYQVSGVTTLAPLTQVNNTTYLTGGNLTSITAGWFTKSTLYVSGEGATQTYFVQHATAQYATLQEAVDAPLPAPLIDPSGVPYIAAIIVQQGTSNIIQIIDIRPKFFGSSGTGVAGVSDHGELTGLLDDDHPQYLLVDGTRAMSGTLNMGTNTITNVGTINSVTIQTHGARHGANAADPTPTAAPTTALTASSVNATGIANTLSRSDHSHQITGFQISDATLTALAAYNTNGILTQTAADTFTGRSIVGTTNRVAITNGNGVSGNPAVDIDSAYIGQTSITTLGTISSGTWNGTPIASTYAGVPAAGTTGQYLSKIDGTNYNTQWVDPNYNTVDATLYRALTSDQSATDPGSGKIKWNNVTQISATQLYMSNINDAGTDISSYLVKLTVNNIFWIQTQSDSSSYQRWTITSITNNSGWFTFGVTLLDSQNPQFSNNRILAIATNSLAGGTVTSIAISGGTTGITTSGGPITTSGTITLAGTLNIANGGTGQTTASSAFNALSPTTTLGDLIYANGTGTNTRLAGNTGTQAQILTQTGNGTISAAPLWSSLSSLAVTSFSAGSTGLTPSSTTTGAVTLTGTLNIANGGTGQTTANAALNALLPTQTGNSGKVLSTNGTSTSWASPGSGTVTSVAVSGGTTGLTTSGSPITTSGTITLAGTLATANGGTGQTTIGTANQLLGVNSSATALEYKTITAGSGIIINNSAGSMTIINADGQAGSGVAGKVYSSIFNSLSGTTVMGTTLPTITSGWQVTSVTLTPTYSTSKFGLTTSFYSDLSSNNHNVSCAVWRTVGAVNTLVGTQTVTITTSGRPATLSITLLDNPATTSSITYSIRVGMDSAGTSYVNQTNAGTNLGGSAESAFFVQEIY